MTVSRFTPSLMPRETLEQIFVARHQILNSLNRRIRDAATGPARQHSLLVGPRGSGKTHLISLVYYQTRDLIEEGQRLQLAWLPEDPWTILSYRNLLAQIHHHLEPNPSPSTADARRNTVDDFEAHLIRSAHTNGPIVVLIENLDQILDQLSEVEQQRLRRLLQTEGALLFIATTTRLDRHLSDQAAPFYGFFTTTRLQPFTVDQARLMLQALAEHAGNDDLAHHLNEPRTTARLQTIAHLAGGQPRIWAALSTALTIDGLDSLVDLLLTRFDDLTPYYQEQLSRLSGHMRVVVAELAQADHPLHVAEIAERVGISQRSIGKTVSELTDRGWISPITSPLLYATDRRRTYYELAEPLARLTFQIKESRGEPLRLVVDFLKGWFDPDDLTRADSLLSVAYLEMARDGFSYDPITRVVRHLTGLPRTPAPALDFLGDIDDALDALHHGDAGPLLQLNVAVRHTLESRLLGPDRNLNDTIAETRYAIHQFSISEAQTQQQPPPISAWITRAEDLIADGHLDAQALLIEWLALDTRTNEAAAVLNAMETRLGNTNPLVLTSRFTLAQQLCITGHVHTGLSHFAQLVQDQRNTLGPGHPDTMITLANMAYWRAEIGDASGAITILTEQLTLRERILGPEHPDTLTTRNNLALWRGQAGDAAGAAAAFAELLPMLERILGPEHPDSLTTRSNLASWRGEAGDVAGAVAAFAELLPLQERILGPEHPDTLTTRNNLASWREQAGDTEG